MHMHLGLFLTFVNKYAIIKDTAEVTNYKDTQ